MDFGQLATVSINLWRAMENLVSRQIWNFSEAIKKGDSNIWRSDISDGAELVVLVTK